MTARSIQRSEAVVAVLLTLFFLGMSVFTMGLSQGDDSWYLSDSVTVLPAQFFQMHYWSPLYLQWLRLLGLVWHDPVWRYFGSWALLTILLALIPLMLKIRYAWIYTALVVASSAPFVFPYIGMFAGVLCLLGICLVLRAASRSELCMTDALAAGCAACVVLGYCRPEFDYGVFLAAVATLIAVASAWRTPVNRTRLTMTALLVLVLAGLTLLVMHRATGQRSGAAFAQHFNYRASLKGLLPTTSPAWQSDYAERTFGIDLTHNATNGSASMGDFFRANPGLFLRHVLANIVDPTTVVVLLLAGATIAWPWWRPQARALRPASLFLAVMVTPVLMDMMVIYPRDHYMMILLPSVTIFALQAIRSERWLRPYLWVPLAVMAFSLLVNVELPRKHFAFPTRDQVGLAQVECMRQVDRSIPGTYGVAFDSVGIRDVYLVTPRTQSNQFTVMGWDAFKVWAVEKHPAWVTLDGGLAGQYGVTPEQMREFLTGELGYMARPCAERARMTMYTPKL